MLSFAQQHRSGNTAEQPSSATQKLLTYAERQLWFGGKRDRSRCQWLRQCQPDDLVVCVGPHRAATASDLSPGGEVGIMRFALPCPASLGTQVPRTARTTQYLRTGVMVTEWNVLGSRDS